MKSPLITFEGERRLFSSRKGIALFLVLAFLALIITLVLAFFSSVTGELSTARVSVSQTTSKQLADTTVQVVSSMIRMATSSSGNNVAWASQPGMIRTYGQSSSDPTSSLASPLAYYKLYSSDDMEITNDEMSSFETAGDLDGQWDLKPALFTDLNSPVKDAGGKTHFPIIDPRAQLAVGSSVVDGFSYSDTAVLSDGVTKKKMDLVNTDSSIPGNQRLPMPVKWIYVLKDGSLTAPSGVDATGKIANWTGASADKTPTASNPIVGRIAFWTDDESCKLNLNTASEPTPWDTPRAVNIQDLNYGRFQPAQKEFQRFPGHPYSNALSPVFFPGASTLSAAQMQSIYDLIPRVQWGGSKAATLDTLSISAVSLDSDRLLASVDEAVFKPADRSASSLITPEMMERSRFFLTTSSRAPEVNLFGQPRVSLWPVWSTASKRTVFDKLAAFCATVGGGATGKEYYFQRADSTSPTADWTGIARNQKLYSYLQTLTNKMVPGFGGQSFKDKWGADRDQILTEIFDYIRCVNSKDTMTGATKYAQDSTGALGLGQITPLQIGPPATATQTQGFGRFYTISQAGMHFICAQEEDAGVLTAASAANKLASGERLVSAAFIFEPWSPSLGYPLLTEYLYFDVKFGAGFTLNGQDLKMKSAGRGLKNGVATQNNGGFSSWDVSSRNHGGSAGIRVLQSFATTPGTKTPSPYPWTNGAQFSMGGKLYDGVKVVGDTMDFTGGTVTVDIYYGGSVNAASLVQTISFNIPSGKFPVPKLVRTGVSKYFRSGNPTTDTTPSYWWTFARYNTSLGWPAHVPGPEYIDATRRWVDHGGPPGFKAGGVFRDEDVVRTIVPAHGDIRFIAAKKVVPPSDFAKVSETLWESTSDRMLHIFDNPQGSHRTYGHCNEPNHTLSGNTVSSPSHRPGGDDRFNVAGNPKSGTMGGIPAAAPDDQLTGSELVKYHWSRLPEIRPGAGKQYNLWNDYDNGVSIWPDGAYINKPDEGNYNSSSGSPYTYFSYTSTDDTNGNHFSPNRLVPSAGMFGSLPTGVLRGRPWETLLFRAEVRKDKANNFHPGTTIPKDHLIMDLFWMPVAEPYAISEPFSTAGKINLNYQIAPFTYIRRATALHGALKGEEPLIIPNSAATYDKLWDGCVNDNNDAAFNSLPNDPKTTDKDVMAQWDKLYKGQSPYDQMRRSIDVAKTLSQADDRFAGTGSYSGKMPDIFHSATEICDLHLVRKGESLSDYQSGKIFQDALATGDNTRERPYVNLYAKLTTRSNVYTVHFRVQVLRKSRSSDESQWDEIKDKVLSEYRGSSLIERYVDASDTTLPDFATDTTKNLDAYYNFRVLSTKRF